MDEDRHVVADILQAAKSCLETRSPHKITLAEISVRAGVRPAMVSYYFGDIEGLVTDILEQSLDEILERTRTLWQAIERNEVANPLRAMIVMFSESYNQHPALTRILISESLREDSRVRSVFLKKWPAFGKKMMDGVISGLCARGYYREGVDVEGIGSMIRSVIFFPLIIKSYLTREGETIEHYLDSRWIDFVTEVFESYLLPRADRQAARERDAVPPR